MDDENEQNRDLVSFFMALGERLKLVAECEAKIARFEAPRFNLFNSTYIGSLENTVTEILADLLDPKGSHGQGSIFLEQFLGTVGFKRALEGEAAKAQVRTQHCTQERRPIDLTVRIGKYILGLENKINAREQPFQIADYIKDIRLNPKDDYFFVFLTPDEKRDPNSCDSKEWERLKKEERVRSLSYAMLSEWLRSWAALCKSDRVRALLQDMTEWARNLRGATVKNSLTEKAISDFVVKHKQHVGASLATCDASDGLRKALVQEFAKALEERMLQELANSFGLQDWSFGARISESGFHDGGAGILLRNRSWPEACEIGMETYGGRFCFGVKWPLATVDLKAQLNAALNAQNMGKSNANDYWPWCPYVRDFRGMKVDRNWYETETLEALHDERGTEIIGHFVGLIVNVAHVVVPILEAAA